MQYDETIVAVGASYNQATKFGPIFIWDLTNKRVEKVLGICSFNHQFNPLLSSTSYKNV